MKARLIILRSGLTLGAQSLASVTNFTAAALALVAGSLEDFARFAIVFQLCQVVVVVGAGSLGEVVLIQSSGASDRPTGRRFNEGAAGVALVLGLVASALFVIGAALSPEYRVPLVLAALGAPGIVAQYVFRATLFAARRPGAVMVIDLIWLLVVLGAGGLDAAGLSLSPNAYLAAWLLGAAVSGLPLVVSGILQGRHHLLHFWRVSGAQALKLAVEAFLARSIYVVSLIATQAIVSTAAAGSLAAAVLVFSPLSIVHTASTALIVPREVAEHGIHVVRSRVPVLVATAVATVTVGWGAVVWVANGAGLGFGPFDLDPNGITAALFAWTLVRYVGVALWRGPLVALRIADAASESLRARVTGTAAQLALPIVGLVVAGLEGGAAGLAIGMLIGAGDAWRRFLLMARTPVSGPPSGRTHLRRPR